MKISKNLLKIVGLGLVAMTLFSCKNSISQTTEFSLDSSLESGKTNNGELVLMSDYNPGFGNAVFFAVEEDGRFEKAVRGDYDETMGWTYNVAPEKNLSWKVYIGSYDLGETVTLNYEGLSFLENQGYSRLGQSYTEDVGYGKAVYFVGSEHPDFAVRGNYKEGTWYLEAGHGFNYWYDVYVGDWNLGEIYNATGSNSALTLADDYTVKTPKTDGIETRRAVLIANLDYEAIIPSTTYAINNTLWNQSFNGKSFAAITRVFDATVEEITKAIKDTFKDSDDDDVNYVFINCHGSGGGTLSIAKNGWMSGATVRAVLDQYIRGEIVFMIDSCHSGVIIGRGLDESEDTFAQDFISSFAGTKSRAYELADSRFHVLCSSTWGQESWTALTHSFAVRYWTEGLGYDLLNSAVINLKADANNDRKVTLAELYAYSEPKIKALYGKNQQAVVYPDNDDFVIGGRY